MVVLKMEQMSLSLGCNMRLRGPRTRKQGVGQCRAQGQSCLYLLEEEDKGTGSLAWR